MKPGRLVLVVGPSGVGKDSVLAASRAALSGDAGIVFPRRVVTRAPELGGEDYLAVSEADFAAAATRGDFALHWGAHGLYYGIPATIRDDLAAGRQVVVNVSRAILDSARRDFANLLVVSVTASPALLRQRLEARGRESLAEITARLARAAAFQISGADVVELRNDGALDESVARFIALLQGDSAAAA